MIQGSKEWFDARCGLFTASRMGDLMARSKKDGTPLKAAQDYINDVLAERLTGKPKTIPQTYAMLRGTELEPDARTCFSFECDANIVEAGFVQHPELPFVGASPDGYLGADGLVEIKCPESITKHLANLKTGAHVKEYWWQVQCQLWVTGRAWCDLVSYHPDFPHSLRIAVQRVEPDAEAFNQMEVACTDAEAEIIYTLLELQNMAGAS